MVSGVAMTSGLHNRGRHSVRETHFITVSVALFAIVVFAVSGSQIVPAVLNSRGDVAELNPGQISAFLLNIALVLFAWRRSVQLKQSFVERDEAKEEVFKLANFDESTGLFNRHRFNERLQEICDHNGAEATLLLIDLDHFKKINELYGRGAGNDVLAIVGKRLREACPRGAECFRFAGDEFAVLLLGTRLTRQRAEAIAGEIQESVSRPLQLASTSTAVGTSIGIATLDRSCLEPPLLVRRADAALGKAKRLGRDRFVYFDEQMAIELSEWLKLEDEIRAGLEGNEFVPHFQPIVDLQEGGLRGFEVLARWDHPTRGLLEPAAFMEVAEATGMISDLSFAVMHEALRVARGWPANLKIAVNISQVQFNDPLIAQRILNVLEATGFPAQRLELEILERCLLEDRKTALMTVTKLKNCGIAMSIEDFGTGFAPLMDIRSLPFDRIKIDRSFVRTLVENGSNDALVKAVAALGKGLSLPMTAEGVESHAVGAKLNELGCTDAQGWLFGKALSAEEVKLGFLSDLAPLQSYPRPIGRIVEPAERKRA